MKKNKNRGHQTAPPSDTIAYEPFVLPKVKKKKIRPHRRVNDTFLGPLERPALQWMVTRLPAWVMPDHLTVFGLLAAVLIFVSYALTTISPAFLWLASLGFILNWFGDSLDGNLARHRHIERPKYGYFIDHSVDALAEAMVFLGAGLSPYLRFDIAAIGLVGYLLLSIHVFLSTYINGEFRISYINLGPTEVRAIAIIANTILFFIGSPVTQVFGVELTVYDIIGIGMAVLLYGIFIVSSIKMAVALSRAETKPQE